MAPQPNQGAPSTDEPMTQQQTSVIDAQPTAAARADATTARTQHPNPNPAAQAPTRQAQARPQAAQGQAPRAATTPGETGEPQERRGIFSEVSVTSAIASALAAATSFALQSQIGLAGSIIGVFVAGAATAIATQVYKGMLAASAEKIRAIPDQELFSPATTRPSDGARQADPFGGDARVPAEAARGEAAYVDPVTGRSVAAQDVDADHTFVRRFPDAPQAVDAQGAGDQAEGGAAQAEGGTRIAPEYMTRAAAKRRHARIKRNAAIAVFAIVLGAVLAYAGIVTWATRGRGIGPTTTETQTQQEEADATAGTGSGSHGTHVRTNQTESDETGTTTETTTTEATPTATQTTTQTPSQTTSGTTGGSATGTTGGSTGSASGGTGQSGSTSGTGTSTGGGTSSGESSSSSSSGTSSGSGSGSQTTGGTSGSSGSTGSTSGTAQAPRHTSS